MAHRSPRVDDKSIGAACWASGPSPAFREFESSARTAVAADEWSPVSAVPSESRTLPASELSDEITMQLSSAVRASGQEPSQRWPSAPRGPTAARGEEVSERRAATSPALASGPPLGSRPNSMETVRGEWSRASVWSSMASVPSSAASVPSSVAYAGPGPSASGPMSLKRSVPPPPL